MDLLENLNKLVKINFFNRENFEEDDEISSDVDNEKSLKYYELEKTFDKICNNSKVTIEKAFVS